MFISVMASLIVLIGVFAYNSGSFHERLVQAENDIELSKAERYDTSLGYRLALWDVGTQGIAERFMFGHGTGMAMNYFEKNIETYKSGLYKDLPKFSAIYHYHNDWLETGMHIGVLGLMAYAYLLWSWFQTLGARQISVLGAALLCFILLSGLTDNLVFLRQTLYLLLVVTAIAISWRKANGVILGQTKNDDGCA